MCDSETWFVYTTNDVLSSPTIGMGVACTTRLIVILCIISKLQVGVVTKTGVGGALINRHAHN